MKFGVRVCTAGLGIWIRCSVRLCNKNLVSHDVYTLIILYHALFRRLFSAVRQGTGGNLLTGKNSTTRISESRNPVLNSVHVLVRFTFHKNYFESSSQLFGILLILPFSLAVHSHSGTRGHCSRVSANRTSSYSS